MDLRPPPDPAEVRAQLERILATGPLANAGRLNRLLKYLVERTLAGEGDQLKEYVLGVEVFDRPSEYDPRIDSIVRVEARRLRGKIEDYYRGVGAADPVVISIPRGSYVPFFDWPGATLPTSGTAAPSASRQRSHTRIFTIGALTTAAIMMAIAANWQSRPGTPSAPEASSAPRVAVLPFVHFSTDPAVALVAERITDGVTSELARIPALSVVSRTSATQFRSEQRPIRDVATTLGADLIVEGSVVVESGRILAVARLVDPIADRKVWVGEYESGPDEIAELQRRAGAEAGAAALTTLKRGQGRRLSPR